MKFFTATNKAVCLAALTLVILSPASAQLAGQYGILDVTANGGINPNTGVAWAQGDQYRLAFHTDGTIDATSNDPSVYDNFATAQANLSSLGNGSIASSTDWTAILYVYTDGTVAAGVSPVSSPLDRSGTADQAGGANQGGAGVPVYAMDGTSCIARNNADIYNGWSNPFDGNATLRLASGSTNNDSDGNEVVASQNVNFSPFLDQFGLGDTANIHGPDVWTGGNSNAVNPAGNTLDELRTSHGNTNANTSGRVWNRFQRNNTDSKSVYALSGLLTVGTGFPALPFAITDIAYSPETNEVTLTWPKTGASSYIVKISPDLIDWDLDLDDGVTEAQDENPADDTQITVTFELFVAPTVKKSFFRVEEQ
ncbi:MAG: hypothetical protein ABF379_07155 [Akkermansiaceae bacterium]